MNRIEQILKGAQELAERGTRRLRHELIGMEKEEFFAHLQDNNIGKVMLIPIEDTRFISSGHPMFGCLLAGTLFATRYQSYDLAGNCRKYCLEETDFHDGSLSEEKRRSYREKNLYTAISRAVEVVRVSKKSTVVGQIQSYTTTI